MAEEKPIDLVLQGGGVKGIALTGALSVLEKEGYVPQNVAGTSAGAIVAALSAAGYTANELREIVFDKEFARFMDKGWEDRLPLIGTTISILADHGIFEGDYLQELMVSLLAAKGVSTFADLVHPDFANDPEIRYRYKAHVIVSDITKRRMWVLPRDAERLGVTPDELSVATAVRMSASFPIFFEPVHFKNPKTDETHTLVDGGLLSNFPVWLFDTEERPSWPTFGLRLVENDPRTSVAERVSLLDFLQNDERSIINFLMNLVATGLEAHDRQYIENADFARTITIPTLGVSTLDFRLTDAEKNALFAAGVTAAESFLAAWDFDAYITAFREQTPQTRRQMVVSYMDQAKS